MTVRWNIKKLALQYILYILYVSSVSSQLSSVLFLEIRYCTAYIYVCIVTEVGRGSTFERLLMFMLDRMSWRLLTGQPKRPAYYSFHGRKNPAPPPPPRAYLKPYQLHGQEAEPRHLSIYVSSVDPKMWSCWVCISWGKKIVWPEKSVHSCDGQNILRTLYPRKMFVYTVVWLLRALYNSHSVM
jgi:hypothetical protein